jgi:hypothetical protein
MDVIKISFYSTNQNPVALYHILDEPSVKLTLFQPPTVVMIGRRATLLLIITTSNNELVTNDFMGRIFASLSNSLVVVWPELIMK